MSYLETCHTVARGSLQGSWERHTNRTAPTEALAAAKEAGLYGLAIPGGLPGSLNLTHTERVMAMIALAEHGDPSFALGFNMHLVATAFLSHPDVNASTRTRMAKLAQEGLFCSLASEPKTRGNDIASFIPSVTAHRVSGGYRIQGVKLFASNFEACRYALVSCKPTWLPGEKSSVLLIVDRQKAAGRITVDDIWHPVGMRSTRSNRVTFDGVFVPEDMLLLETANFLGLFLGECGISTYGYYTGVYLGAAKQLARELTERHPRSVRRIEDEAVIPLRASEGVLLRAAAMYDNGPSEAAAFALVQAKYEVGRTVSEVVSALLVMFALRTELMTPESGMSDGRPIELLLNLLLVHAMPPTTEMCERVIELGGMPKL